MRKNLTVTQMKIRAHCRINKCRNPRNSKGSKKKKKGGRGVDEER